MENIDNNNGSDVIILLGGGEKNMEERFNAIKSELNNLKNITNEKLYLNITGLPNEIYFYLGLLKDY